MKLSCIIFALALTACSTSPPVEQADWVGRYGNACLPEAAVMAQGLRDKGLHARVLRIGTQEWSHAVCTYLYPPGENKLWAWDSFWMSLRVRAWTDDPYSIARAWLKATHPWTELQSAEFLD